MYLNRILKITDKSFQYKGNAGMDRGDRMLQKVSAWHCVACDSSWKGKRQLLGARIEFISYSNFIVSTAPILLSKGSATWCCFWFVYACQGSYNQNYFNSSQSFCHEEKPEWLIDWQVKRGRKRKKEAWVEIMMRNVCFIQSTLCRACLTSQQRPCGRVRLQKDTGFQNHRCLEFPSWYVKTIPSCFIYST